MAGDCAGWNGCVVHDDSFCLFVIPVLYAGVVTDKEGINLVLHNEVCLLPFIKGIDQPCLIELNTHDLVIMFYRRPVGQGIAGKDADPGPGSVFFYFAQKVCDEFDFHLTCDVAVGVFIMGSVPVHTYKDKGKSGISVIGHDKILAGSVVRGYDEIRLPGLDKIFDLEGLNLLQRITFFSFGIHIDFTHGYSGGRENFTDSFAHDHARRIFSIIRIHVQDFCCLCWFRCSRLFC